MAWEECRRITGRHPLIAVPGVGAELVGVDGRDAEIERVLQRVHVGWSDLEWPEPVICRRDHASGVSLAISAPVDQLYTAVELLEWAVGDALLDLEPIWRQQDEEANGKLVELHTEHRPSFFDEDGLTLGLGRHAHTYPLDALPQRRVSQPSPIPFVYVTGTNGKTTTARMLARMANESGLRAGHTCSDGVVVGGEYLERGDWTGPGAARALLRHEDVDYAVLETARGGLMRRGLVLDNADAAAVTNISDDHLGEWGLHDLPGMAWAKLTVAHALKPGGVLVVHGRDPVLLQAVEAVKVARPDIFVWTFADDAGGDLTAFVQDGSIWVRRMGAEWLIDIAEIPATLGGSARHNVENAMCAALLALASGVEFTAIQRGLASFRPSVEHSRGRLNHFTMPGGGSVIVDFAHNPDAVRRLAGVADAWRPGQIRIVSGQAGDRTDALLKSLAEAVADTGPDVVILKELADYRRGRAVGEVCDIMAEVLRARGITQIQRVETEVDAARAAVDGLGPKDLALLVTHEDFDGVVAFLRAQGATEG